MIRWRKNVFETIYDLTFCWISTLSSDPCLLSILFMLAILLLINYYWALCWQPANAIKNIEKWVLFFVRASHWDAFSRASDLRFGYFRNRIKWLMWMHNVISIDRSNECDRSWVWIFQEWIECQLDWKCLWFGRRRFYENCSPACFKLQ